eukprot:Gb_20882 [translate_table: standard]
MHATAASCVVKFTNPKSLRLAVGMLRASTTRSISPYFFRRSFTRSSSQNAGSPSTKTDLT